MLKKQQELSISKHKESNPDPQYQIPLFSLHFLGDIPRQNLLKNLAVMATLRLFIQLFFSDFQMDYQYKFLRSNSI